jgi:hypothetical protein
MTAAVVVVVLVGSSTVSMAMADRWSDGDGRMMSENEAKWREEGRK